MKDFRPINAHGRSMRPPGVKRNATPRPALWQVRVETEEGDVIPVFPKFEKSVAADLMAALSKAIIDGKIKGWRHPHLVKVT